MHIAVLSHPAQICDWCDWSHLKDRDRFEGNSVLPELGARLDEQFDTVEASLRGGVVQRQGADVRLLHARHLRLLQKPLDHVPTAVPAVWIMHAIRWSAISNQQSA